MTTAIIAEKPSVAREISRIVGATNKHNGYIEGNNYKVTWALGHLISLAMPEQYGFEIFKRENLPIIPSPFKLIPRQIREGKIYKPDAGALKQLNVIKEIFSECDKIIVATDAGREGELIFRYIYNYLGCKKPFERLWINSLTDKAIYEGLQNLKTGAQYDNLYQAAKARSQADWLVGINASQALSIAAGRGAFSLGRVQTPTFAMICSRYFENKNFTSEKYWQIQISAEKDGVKFNAVSTEKIEAKTMAETIFNNIRSAQNISVKSIETKTANQEPPLLYDLTTLQKEANSRFGFSAEKTLAVAQRLYEAKLTTYPRTGSRYIPDDVFAVIPKLIENLKTYPRFADSAKLLSSFNKRSIDDKKVTDHHALLITENIPDNLNADDKIIYEMIAGRMIEAFSQKCVKEITTIVFVCAGTEFSAKGTIIKENGWRNVFNAKEETENEETIALPVLSEGETLPISNTQILEKQTNPKPLHTESSLLSSMENAGSDLENEEEREALKTLGIGTPATRAAIIETLFARDYIRREKKSLVPTDKGLKVYEVVNSMKIADVQMTGMWENMLLKIEHGEIQPETFFENIRIFTTQITDELLSAKIAGERSATFTCPKCGSPDIVFYEKVVKCHNENCGLTIFRNICGKNLTDKQVTKLLTSGKTETIKGFKSKSGKTFEAAVMFDSQYKTVFVFAEKKQKKG